MLIGFTWSINRKKKLDLGVALFHCCQIQTFWELWEKVMDGLFDGFELI